jgi:phosphoribosylformylglycinamidine cyclo-ligase
VNNEGGEGRGSIRVTRGVDQVNYDALDRVKLRCIQASRRTLECASDYGAVLDGALGASANVFTIPLRGLLANGGEKGAGELAVSLVTEGLGTADDARPEDLTSEEEYQFWYHIAIKTISALTNDVASCGMRPLLISQYLPTSTPERVFSEAFLDGFLDGFVSGCKTVGAVYISGETPQLKTKIVEGRIDVAGAVFGIMPSGVAPIGGAELAPGQEIIFVASSGPQENGYTPLRELAASLPLGYRTKLTSGTEYWRALNAPSVLYSPLVQEVLRRGIRPVSMENISGHGWLKIMRGKQPLRYRIEQMLTVPEVFSFYAEKKGLALEDLLSVFNLGTGFMIIARDGNDAHGIVRSAEDLGYRALRAGRTEEVAGEGREVVVEPLGVRLGDGGFLLRKG